MSDATPQTASFCVPWNAPQVFAASRFQTRETARVVHKFMQVVAKFNDGVPLSLENTYEAMHNMYVAANIMGIVGDMGGAPYHSLQIEINDARAMIVLLEPDVHRWAGLLT